MERSFSQMKQIETRLRNRINDQNLTYYLMRLVIEGPAHANFNEVLDIFKSNNSLIIYFPCVEENLLRDRES